MGDVSILVNNAGIVTGKKFIEAPDSLIEKTMEVNTMAHFWVSQRTELLSLFFMKTFFPKVMIYKQKSQRKLHKKK